MKPQSAIYARLPFWATRDFRFLIIVVVMALSVVGVLVFEIGPLLQARGKPLVRKADPNGWIPPKEGEGAREVRFDGVLAKVKDATPVGAPEDPYASLIRSLSKSDPESFAREAKPVDYALYSRMPDALRGVTVRLKALFLDSRPLRLPKAEGEVEWIYRTYLVDPSGKEGYVVDLIDCPPPLSRRDLVTTEAVFYKLGTYEGNTGVVQAPYLVGRNMRFEKERMERDPFNMGFLVMSVSGLALVGVVVLTIRVWRKSRSVVRLKRLTST